MLQQTRVTPAPLSLVFIPAPYSSLYTQFQSQIFRSCRNIVSTLCRCYPRGKRLSVIITRLSCLKNRTNLFSSLLLNSDRLHLPDIAAIFPNGAVGREFPYPGHVKDRHLRPLGLIAINLARAILTGSLDIFRWMA